MNVIVVCVFSYQYVCLCCVFTVLVNCLLNVFVICVGKVNVFSFKISVVLVVLVCV